MASLFVRGCCVGIWIVSMWWIQVALAQTRPKPEEQQLMARKLGAGEKITIDGLLTEAHWQPLSPGHQASASLLTLAVTGLKETAETFHLNFPVDTMTATAQTQVQVAYDDHFVYIAAVCHRKQERYVISSLRRDFGFQQNDNFTVLIDPFSDGLNGFSFGVSPYGVQSEALISDGRFTDGSWDNRWWAEVKSQPDRWTVEMAIPFKTLRFKAGTKEWKMNFIRNDLVANERSSWSPVPIIFDLFSMAFFGHVHFEDPLPAPGANVALIPYVSGQGSRRHSEGKDAQYKADVGMDAKIGVTPSLNLDLTINPDFSQVEVDQQVVNLDVFEIFFPERRQFFLENSDLFARFGFSRIRPFFSRRIGIARDTSTGTIVQNPILYGARLSGKVNRDWRVGLLNMQTASRPEAGITGQNYTVGVFQRQVFSRSNIAGILVNRQATSPVDDPLSFTRMAGIDYNLQSKDNKWWGKFFYHRAFKPDQQAESDAHAVFLLRQGRNVGFAWNHEYIGRGYQINDVGFVQRTGIFRIEPNANVQFFPKSKWLYQYSFNLYLDLYTDLNRVPNDRTFSQSFNMRFLNQAELGVIRSSFYRLLLQPLELVPGSTPLRAGSEHYYDRILGYYSSNPRKLFTFYFDALYGSFFNGTRLASYGSVGYRFQPYGAISLNYQYNDIRLPEGYGQTQLWLAGTRLDVSFSRSLFLTTFIQYNEQANNLNHNTRLQWRFRPVSDLFVVYTDNYLPENFATKNRALIVKFTYWLHL